ncbi:MAG: hypothetical protein LBJ17_00470 [Dysgonamonadaceae bacterium]|jgi:hypothetical protein|nr:hypothetical protein [Dysgonamonadaceae bacterium]
MKQLFILLLLAAICSTKICAQTGSDTTLNREMLLEREYNPAIRDAQKIGSLPEINEQQSPRSTVEYSNYAAPFNFKPAPSDMKPQVWMSDFNVSKNKGYLSGGVSTLLDFDAGAGYQVLDTWEDYLDFNLSFHSGNSTQNFLQAVDLKQKFKFADLLGGFNLRHDFDKIRLKANAEYTFSKYSLSHLRLDRQMKYFVDTAGIFDPENNLFQTSIGISSLETEEFFYSANIRYNYFGQQYAAEDSSRLKENNISLDWNFRKQTVPDNGLGLQGSLENFFYSSPDNFSASNGGLNQYTAVSLTPYYYIMSDKLDLSLGIKFDSEQGWQRKTRFAPAVRLNYNFNTPAQLYIIAEGGRHNNSKYGIFYENRFAPPVHRIFDAHSPLDATVGIRFLPDKEVNINLYAGYKITKEEHYFAPVFVASDLVPNISSYNLDVLYGDESAIKAGGEIIYRFAGNLEIDLKGQYVHRNIESDSFTTAMHKPNFEATANITYKLSELPLNFDLSYRGLYGLKVSEYYTFISPPSSSAYIPPYTTEIRMKDIHHASLKATYTFKTDLSFYVRLNNIFMQQYDIWYGYPAQDFSLMAGVSFLF